MKTQATNGVPQDSFELRLRIARFAAGDLTAKDAASLVGVSGQTWRNWESGLHLDGARKPSMLRFIADELGVDEDWLRHGGPLAPEPGGGTVLDVRGRLSAASHTPTRGYVADDVVADLRDSSPLNWAA